MKQARLLCVLLALALVCSFGIAPMGVLAEGVEVSATKVLDLDMETLTDTTGNEYTIVNGGGVANQSTQPATGPSGQTVRKFGGANNHIDVTGTKVDIGSNGLYVFTVEMWVKYTTFANNRLMSKPNLAGGMHGFAPYISTAGRPQFYVDITPGDPNTSQQIQYEPTAGPTLNTGEWLHIVITYDGSNASAQPAVYVNGNAYTFKGGSGGMLVPSDGTPLYIGNVNQGGFSRGFVGEMGAFRFYHGIITETEAQALYMNEIGLYEPDFPVTITAGGSTVSDYTAVATDVSQITIDLSSIADMNSVTEDVLTPDTVQLVNTKTGVSYDYTGTLDKAGKKFTITGLAPLQTGTPYELRILGSLDSDVDPSLKLVRKLTQTLAFTTVTGFTADVSYQKQGGSLTVTAAITNGMPDGEDVMMMAGIYKGDTLVALRAAKVGADGSNAGSVTLENIPQESGYTVKTFLFNGFTTMNVWSQSFEKALDEI